jgi:hypothetical protein
MWPQAKRAAVSPFVSRKEALKKRTHHQFINGIGYIAHSGPPELPAACNGNKNCDPPKNTRDGSVHVLLPPNGAGPMKFTWIAAEQAWASTVPDKGNRLAWPTSHLQRAGWSYAGPEEDKPAKKTA